MYHADPHPFITYHADHYGPCRPVSRFHYGLAALVRKGHSLASPPQCHRTEGTDMNRNQPMATLSYEKMWHAFAKQSSLILILECPFLC